ncbi:2-amino-4-hydroxy-6-hydroxymethyldihydropteridine diphosphokinase [Eionea flava]
MTHHSIAYIGLGSNLNKPLTQIDSAISVLRNTSTLSDVQCSFYYASKAVGPGEQPDYVNAAIRCKTQQSPHALLKLLQTIENTHGRQRDIRWGARTLDLDLLLYNNLTVQDDTLQVPHPEIKNRNFVLYPLFDLNPELIFPNGDTLRDALQHMPMTDLHRIEPHASIVGESLPHTPSNNEPLS